MFLFDTHVHTSESSVCGKSTAAQQVAYYKKEGYDGFVITDHFKPRDADGKRGALPWNERVAIQWRGYEEAKKFETPDFTVLHGTEIRFKGYDNDYLVFGADKQFFYDNPEITETSIENFRKVTKEHGGILIFQAHPFRNHMTIINPLLVDGIEVYNGNSSHNSRNEIAMLWAEKNNMLKLSGSDCHREWEASPGGILFEEKPRNEAEFVDMIRKSQYKLK